jgi:putative membrane protein
MDTINISDLVRAVLYSLIGFFTFLFCVFVAGRVIPFDFWKEIRENRNTAVGVVTGALYIAIAIIIAAAVH